MRYLTIVAAATVALGALAAADNELVVAEGDKFW